MKNAELILEMNITNSKDDFLLRNYNIKMFLFLTGHEFTAVLRRKNFSKIIQTAVSIVKLNAPKALI